MQGFWFSQSPSERIEFVHRTNMWHLLLLKFLGEAVLSTRRVGRANEETPSWPARSCTTERESFLFSQHRF